MNSPFTVEEKNLYFYQYPRAANTSSVVAFTHPLSWDLATVQVFGIIRGKEPFLGQPALVGGFHDVLAKETLRQTAQREFKEELGLKLPEASFEFLFEQSDPNRDPREFVIDHVFAVELTECDVEKLQAGDDAAEIYKFPFNLNVHPDNWFGETKWAFDHTDSITRFLHSRRQQLILRNLLNA